MKKNSHLVYSTSSEASTTVKEIVQQRQATANTQKTDGIVRIYRQTKGRKGNGVSIVVGLTADETSLKVLAKQLKQTLGIGGSVKHGNIELQTSQRQKIKEYLQSKGYPVKIAGG